MLGKRTIHLGDGASNFPGPAISWIEQGTGEGRHAQDDRGDESIVHEDEVAPVGV